MKSKEQFPEIDKKQLEVLYQNLSNYLRPFLLIQRQANKPSDVDSLLPI